MKAGLQDRASTLCDPPHPADLALAILPAEEHPNIKPRDHQGPKPEEKC